MNQPEPEPSACGVCAQPLFPASHGGEVVAWLHRDELVNIWPEGDPTPEQIKTAKERLGVEEVDHLAVPVPIEQVRTETMCDFCSAPKPGWLLPVESFEHTAGQVSYKDYAVCEVCARSIKKGRWERVVQRGAENAAQRYGIPPSDPGLREQLETLMGQVREHQSGPVRRAE